MWKRENSLKNRDFSLHRHCEKNKSLFHENLRRRVFHSKVILIHRRWGKVQRLELMLVVISFTLSAKAESLFICFSTLSME